MILNWITPIGPTIGLGINKVLNKHKGDPTQLINFSLQGNL